MRFLRGKRCLVTGASSGIGRALTAELCSRKARVIGVSRRLPDQPLSWPEEGEQLHAKLDVTDEPRVNQAFGQLDGLDVLVLCAGSASFGRVGELESNDFRDLFDVHVLGSFLCVRAALELMKPGSQVLCIGSITARRALSECAAYAAAKAGQDALLKVLAEEERDRGILVTRIIAGAVYTELWDQRSGFGEDKMMPVDEFAGFACDLLQRPGLSPEEVQLFPPLGVL